MSEEHNSANYFYIQSVNRLNGTATNFFVNNQNFGNSSSMELQLVQIPYTFYPLDSFHNILVFQINGSGIDLTVTMTPGAYTSASFASSLASLMQAATGNTQTYSVSISATTGLLTITQNSGVFILRNSVSTINPIAGLSSIDSASSITQTSTNIVNLGGTDWIDIISSELTKYDTRSFDTGSSGASRVARIPIKDYQWGSTIQYRPKFHMMNHRPYEQGNIDVALYDMYGNLINLNGREWFMKFKHHSDKAHRKSIRAGNHNDYFSSANILANKL